ncbi:MAG: 50S ribosomal protein L10 [Actinobacteria bacterium]|nr:50S ribosomal protein L10 [Actinomycetota bacterium]
MPSEKNIEKVKQAGKWFKESDSVLLLHYTGLKVSEAGELRGQLIEQEAALRVIKNTLAKIALADAGREEIIEFIDGPTAAVFVSGDFAATTKSIMSFSKGRNGLWIQGGLLDGVVLSREDAEKIATLPSREVLLAQTAGRLSSPLSALAGVCSGLFRNVLGGFSALAAQKEG